MITTRELQSNSNAFTKAGAVKPPVFKRENGFAVQGANDIYSVSIQGEVENAVIDCNCKAGQNSKPCYHAASAFQVFLNDKAKAAKAAEDFDFELISAELSQPVQSRTDRLLAEQAAQIQTLETKVSQLERRFTALLNRVETEAEFVDYVNTKYSKAY
jgi:hypothetical protein